MPTNSHTLWTDHISNNLSSTQLLQSNCLPIHTKFEHTICQIIWVLRNFCKVIAYKFTQSLNTLYIKKFEFYAIFAKELPTNSHKVWRHHMSNNWSSTQFLQSNYLQIHTKFEHSIYHLVWVLRNFCKVIAYIFTQSLNTPYIKYLEFHAIFAKQLPTNSHTLWTHHISNKLSSTQFLQSDCPQIHTKFERMIYQIIWIPRNFCKLIAYKFTYTLNTSYIK